MMTRTKAPCVIAVASVSGGGKTTIVRQLIQQLPNAKAFFFDDYDFEGPDNPVLWLEQGADVNEWNLAPLLKDMEKLFNGTCDYIILDFPFAYQHNQANKYIDFTAYIDTPLDLALVRRLRRDFSDASVQEIQENIHFYAQKGRAAYLHMEKTIKPDSDFVVDGTKSAVEIIEDIIKEIGRRIEKKKS